ncbi:MAG TPA: hypothetical protein VFF11_02650, partial [Candidatus Binatia bacterium]|nr:hypothetical protein [Candidatus Binatia bacterium]
ARTDSRLPPGAGAAAAAVCVCLGFFALRANAGAAINSKHKIVNAENANRDDFNCGNVNREKLDFGFMEYIVFLLVSADGAARSLHPENSGPIEAASEPDTENNL